MSVSTYVKNKKIEVAKDLLKFSDYSMIEIANHLSFSSQSHFIQQFKEVVGITPKNIVIRIIMLNGMKRFGQKVTRLIVLLKLCNTHKHSM